MGLSLIKNINKYFKKLQIHPAKFAIDNNLNERIFISVLEGKHTPSTTYVYHLSKKLNVSVFDLTGEEPKRKRFLNLREHILREGVKLAEIIGYKKINYGVLARHSKISKGSIAYQFSTVAILRKEILKQAMLEKNNLVLNQGK